MRRNLKAYREKRGMSQTDIANLLGITRASFSAIERGVREGKQIFWESLQRELDIPSEQMWDLMKDDPE